MSSDNVDDDREAKRVDENTVQIFIRGRPVSLDIPRQYQANYDKEKQVQ